MGSVHSHEASPLKPAYVTAKHGLLGLARVLAKEGAKHNVRSHVVCPSFVRTSLVDKQIPEQAKELGISEEEVVKRVMLGGTVDGVFATVEDVAQTVLFLSAFETAALTGNRSSSVTAGSCNKKRKRRDSRERQQETVARGTRAAAHRLAALRDRRADAAGRRRAGHVQAGVYQGLHETDMIFIRLEDCRHFDRRTQYGDHCGERAAGSRHASVRVLGDICQPAFGFPIPAMLERVLFDSANEIRKAFTKFQAASALVEGQKVFFVPRFPPPSPIASKHAADRTLLRYHAAQGHARTPLRFRPHQFGRDARVGRRDEDQAARGTFHGVGRVAAGVCRGRDQRPVLLGRWAHVEHAAL